MSGAGGQNQQGLSSNPLNGLQLNETAVLKRFLFIMIALYQTIMIFPFSFVFVLSIYTLIQCTDPDFLAGNDQYYLLVVTNVIGLILYLFIYSYNHVALSYNLPSDRIPWASLNKENLNFKELLKFSIIAICTVETELNNNNYVQASVFIAITSFQVFQTLKRTQYFDHFVSFIHEIIQIMLLSLNFIQVGRSFLKIQLFELLFYWPFLFYGLYKLFHRYDQKQFQGFINLLNDVEKIKVSQLQNLLYYFRLMIERQNSEDQILMQKMIFQHRLKCLNASCPCRHSLFESLDSDSEDSEQLLEKEEGIDPPSSYDVLAHAPSMMHMSLYKSKKNQSGRIPLHKDSQKSSMRDSIFDRDQFSGPIQINNLEFESQYKQGRQSPIHKRSTKRLHYHSGVYQEIESVINNKDDTHTVRGRTMDSQNLNKNGKGSITDQSSQSNALQIRDVKTNQFVTFSNQIIQKPQSAFNNNNSNNQQYTFPLDQIVEGFQLQDFFRDQLNLNTQNMQNGNLFSDHRNKTFNNNLKDKQQQRHQIFRKFFLFLLREILQHYMSSYEYGGYASKTNQQLLYTFIQHDSTGQTYQTLLQILALSKNLKNHGIFETIRFKIKEKIILNLVQQCINENKNQSQSLSTPDNFSDSPDYFKFIQNNHKSLSLDLLYDQSLDEIIEFWTKLRTRDMTPKEFYKRGILISQIIQKQKLLINQLDDDQNFKKDTKKFQIYALYQQQILNDSIEMSSILNKLKNYHLNFMNKKNISGQSIELDVGIFIVDAWGKNRLSWEFLNANQAFCDIYKINQDQVLGLNINNIIPYSLLKWHDLLIREFFIKGNSKMLNQHRVMFGRTTDGFLIPLRLKVNFSYNQKFGYSFIGVVEKFKQMNLFMDETNKFNTNDFIFLIANIDGVLQDISESFLKLVKMSLDEWEYFEEHKGRKIQLQNLIQDFDELLNEYGINDLQRTFDSKNIVNKLVKIYNYDRITGDFDPHNVQVCIMTYYQRKIVTQSGECQIFQKVVLFPLTKHPELEFAQRSTINLSLKKGSQSPTRILKSLNSQIGQNNLIGTTTPHDLDQIYLDDSGESEQQIMSMSSLSSTSSSNNSKLTSQYAKSHLFQSRVPRLLKINMLFLGTLLLVYVVISIYNLSSFTSKHSDIINRIDALGYISQRNAHQKSILMCIKFMQSLALYPQILNQSDILMPGMTRADLLQGAVDDMLSTMLDNQQSLNEFIMKNPDYSIFNLDYNNLNFITEEGYIYYQNVTFKHAIDLYGTYAQFADVNIILQQKPQLNVLNYVQNSTNTNPNYQISQLQQTLFFLSENGLYWMSALGNQQLTMLMKQTVDQSDLALSSLNIAVFISIGLISALSILIFPQLARLVSRHQMVVRYFNQLPQVVVDNQLLSAIKFKNTFYNHDHQSGPTYLDSIQNKAINSGNKLALIIQQERMRQEQMIQENQEGVDINFEEKEDQSESESKEPESYAPQQIQVIPSFNSNDSKSKKSHNLKQNIKQGGKTIMNFKSQERLEKLNGQQKNPLKKYKESSIQIKPALKEIDKGVFQEESVDENKKDKHHKGKSKKKTLKNVQKTISVNLKATDQKEGSLQELFEKKISQDTLSKYIKTFIIIISVGGFLCAALITSYFQAQILFSNSNQAGVILRQYFFREECTYVMILFMRETLIKGFDIDAYVYTTDTNSFIETVSYDYYFSQCSSNEDQLSQLKKNIPSFLKNQEALFRGFDTNQLCNLTYRSMDNAADYNVTMEQYCEIVYNGIMNNGLGSFIQYVMSFIQSLDIQYDNYKQYSNFTTAYAPQMLNSRTFTDISDLILFMLPSAHDAAQGAVQIESTNYFYLAKTQYIMAFAIFMPFTLVFSSIAGYFIYQKVKKRLLDIENLLALMPLDILDNNFKQQIENYLKY